MERFRYFLTKAENHALAHGIIRGEKWLQKNHPELYHKIIKDKIAFTHLTKNGWKCK